MPRIQRGFTLLEVLVAVAVLGVAMAAIIKASLELTANAVDLRDKTFAAWVAGNVATELRLQRAWETGEEKGEAEMGGRRYYWTTEIQDTENPDLRRLDVHVYDDADRHRRLIVHTGLLPDPAREMIPDPIDATAVEQ